MSSGSNQLWPRRNGTTWVRVGLVVFIVFYIWFQQYLVTFHDTKSSYFEANDSNVAILSMAPIVLYKVTNISEMKQKIAQYNMQQVVRNKNIFEPLQNDSIIIIIQVHDRVTYLRHLIMRLAQAANISRTLLVFSHDYYNEAINNLVQSIDFCKVIQIFFPYSIQYYPNEFPGEDPGDCPRDMKKEQALLKKCNNALYPDSYGHYREAKFTQTKHHWWWKANRVFSQLEVTRNHTGLVVFLEEDHYVAEDFLHLLKLMEQAHKEFCKHCNILSIGTYKKTYNYFGGSKNVEISAWISSKHNMGMAFNRFTWLQIVECAAYFCKYDDYNWDWSLQHISQNCLKQKLHVMVAREPRVFHIGECGLHHKKRYCDSTSVISKIQKLLESEKRYLFPEYLNLTHSTITKETHLGKGNGGWGDRRDHKLCMDMTIKQ